MTYELHHSGILTGSVNCFCLTCESYLESRQDALSHIGTSSHLENQGAVPYLDRFKDQNIRKFKNGYFCEFCNELMATAVQVNVHVSKQQHKQNRGSILLKSSRNEVIAFDDIVIQERAWHGLMDKVCCICDIEIEDEVVHKKFTSHLLSLIQKPIKFGVNDSIYRQIADLLIQCLTCNKLLPTNMMSEHFNSPEHLDVISKSKLQANQEFEDTLKQDNKRNETDLTALNDSVNNNEYGRHETLEVHETFEAMLLAAIDESIDINYETEAAFSFDCLPAVNIGNDDIEKHIDKFSEGEPSTSTAVQYDFDVDANEILNLNHNNDDTDNPVEKSSNDSQTQNSNSASQDMTENSTLPNLPCPQTSTDNFSSADLHQFAKDNNITYDPKAIGAFCRICQVKLPASMRSMKEHVKGGSHSRKFTAVTTRTKVNHQQTTLPLEQFLRKLKVLRSPFDSGYLVNGKYYISQKSFLLFKETESGNGYNCLLCGLVLPICQWRNGEHLESCSYPSGQKALVVTSEKEEFIREIHPGSFHCGYCHIVAASWSEMVKHLKAYEHITAKSNAKLRASVFSGQLPRCALALCNDG